MESKNFYDVHELTKICHFYRPPMRSGGCLISELDIFKICIILALAVNNSEFYQLTDTNTVLCKDGYIMLNMAQ